MRSISGKIFPRKAWMYINEADLVKDWKTFYSLYKACGPCYASASKIDHKTSRIQQHLKDTYSFEIN